MRTLRTPAIILAALIGTGVAMPPASATVVLAVDFDEMAAQADRVVVGKVTSVVARWSADQSIIETAIDVAVETDLSGASATPALRIVQPGGEIDGRGYFVTGFPTFRKGERVLLFLRAGGLDGFGEPYHRVFGMAQGKFVIFPRVGGGYDAIQQFPSGFGLASADEQGNVRMGDGARPAVIDLDEALDRIRAVRGEVTP